jgi:hypothetical protein
MMNVLRRLTVSFDLRGKAFFYLTAIFLSLFAIFNILTLLVPVGTNDKLNSLLSLILFSSYELFAVFSALNIRRKPGHLNWVPYQGFATALINIALMVPFSAGLIIANWITIALCWTYILSFIYEISDV